MPQTQSQTETSAPRNYPQVIDRIKTLLSQRRQRDDKLHEQQTNWYQQMEQKLNQLQPTQAFQGNGATNQAQLAQQDSAPARSSGPTAQRQAKAAGR